VTVPPLFSDLVERALSDRVKVKIVANVPSRSQIPAQLRRLHPDLVVVRLRRGEDDRIARSILRALPGAIVIAISANAKQAYVHEMRPHRTLLIDLSRNDLIEQISGWMARTAARDPIH
jgi:DNA-binding NarL/FixJ family response regulator